MGREKGRGRNGGKKGEGEEEGEVMSRFRGWTPLSALQKK